MLTSVAPDVRQYGMELRLDPGADPHGSISLVVLQPEVPIIWLVVCVGVLRLTRVGGGADRFRPVVNRRGRGWRGRPTTIRATSVCAPTSNPGRPPRRQ